MSPDAQLPDGQHSAVVDRITEDQAVLLVGDEETEVHVPAAELPAGATPGTWLVVTVDAGSVQVVGVDPDGEDAARRRTAERLERIRRSQGGSRFGR